MRNMLKKHSCLALLPVFFILFSLPCSARQNAEPSAHQPDSAPSLLQPAQDGTYESGSGLKRPVFIRREAVAVPPEAENPEPGSTLLSVVIQPNGRPEQIKILHSYNPVCDQAVIQAVGKSVFDAGTADGKPVPVRIPIIVRYTKDGRTLYPYILRAAALHPDGQVRNEQVQNEQAQNAHQPVLAGDHPILIHSVDPQYSKKARKAKLQGTVLISMVVTAEGLPSDIQVVRSLGMGLDENAVESVRQYRFKPAMKDGVPIPASIHVSVNFHLY